MKKRQNSWEKEIKDLDLEKKGKETQLQCVLREQVKKQEKRTTQAVDKVGRTIFIGDRVITTTVGRFREQSGIVKNIKKWITFTYMNGVK